jgi:hypothetical protein
VGAVTTYIGYQQFDSTLTAYNQAATDLENIRDWWRALPPEEKADPANIDELVQHVEQVLDTELAGWVQKMTDALSELRKPNEPKDKDPDQASSNKEVPAPPLGDSAGAPNTIPAATASTP